MHHKYAYQFDAKRLIEHFGGAPTVTSILNDAGAAVTLKGVQKMRERNYMQSDVLATLLLVSGKYGMSLDLKHFITERSN